MSTYKPRRRYRDEPGPFEFLRYMESDKDYLENNRHLAVRLLDEYGSVARHKPMKPGQISRLYDRADKALNAYAEAEMRRIMATDKRLGCLLKCMGELTAYDKNMDSMSYMGEYGPPIPAAVVRLHDLLNELDSAYAVRTGHPLKLTRQADGSIKETRDW